VCLDSVIYDAGGGFAWCASHCKLTFIIRTEQSVFTHLFIGDVIRNVVERDDHELPPVVDQTERYVADRQPPALDRLLDVLDSTRRFERDADNAATVSEELGDAGHLLGIDGLHQ